MTLSDTFPIARLFPPKNPDVIQLYSFPTPNGVKISIALEETGLAYEPHRIDIMANVQKTPEFLALNPNGKIPAIIDPHGPDGQPIGLFESGAILSWIADKTGKLTPTGARERIEMLEWLFFQVGGIGPMFGQFGYFFKFGGAKLDDPHALNRYRDESRRLLGVLEGRLKDREWIMGETYTMADIAIFPWVNALRGVYDAAKELELHEFGRVLAWLDTCMRRPAVKRAMTIPEAED